MQGVDDKPGVCVRSTKKLKPGRTLLIAAVLAAVAKVLMTTSGMRQILFFKEELHAVGQSIIERNLSDGGVDGHLELRPIDLLQRSLNDAVLFLIGVDQQCIVDGVCSDPHILKQRSSPALGQAAALRKIASGTAARACCDRPEVASANRALKPAGGVAAGCCEPDCGEPIAPPVCPLLEATRPPPGIS